MLLHVGVADVIRYCTYPKFGPRWGKRVTVQPSRLPVSVLVRGYIRISDTCRTNSKVQGSDAEWT